MIKSPAALGRRIAVLCNVPDAVVTLIGGYIVFSTLLLLVSFGFWHTDTGFLSSVVVAGVFLLVLLSGLVAEFGAARNALVPSLAAVTVAHLLCFVHNLVVDHIPNHPKVSFRSSLVGGGLPPRWGVDASLFPLVPTFRWTVAARSGVNISRALGPFFQTQRMRFFFLTLCRHEIPRVAFRRYVRAAWARAVRFQGLAHAHPVYFVSTLFVFVLFANLLGMVPYSFAITSQLVLTFTLSFVAFVGLNVFAVRDFGLHFLDLFLPTGVPLLLSPFVIAIEVISYIARVFSLGIRLFANIMAGHTLLKILAGFMTAALVALFQANPLLLPLFFLPALLFAIVTLLEFAIAFLQAYVFTVLVCLYINDVYSIGSH